MSHYAEYKRGYIDEFEFNMACNHEFAGDDEYTEHIEAKCEYCTHYDGKGCDLGCEIHDDECDFILIDDI